MTIDDKHGVFLVDPTPGELVIRETTFTGTGKRVDCAPRQKVAPFNPRVPPKLSVTIETVSMSLTCFESAAGWRAYVYAVPGDTRLDEALELCELADRLFMVLADAHHGRAWGTSWRT